MSFLKADCVIFRGTHHHKELSRRNFVSVEMAFMGEIWKWWDQFKWCIFLGGRWCCSSPLSAVWPREWDLTSWLLENSFISIPLYSVICCTFKQTQSVFMAFQHEGPILLPVTPLEMHWLQLLWQGSDQKAPCNGSNSNWAWLHPWETDFAYKATPKLVQCFSSSIFLLKAFRFYIYYWRRHSFLSHPKAAVLTLEI